MVVAVMAHACCRSAARPPYRLDALNRCPLGEASAGGSSLFARRNNASNSQIILTVSCPSCVHCWSLCFLDNCKINTNHQNMYFRLFCQGRKWFLFVRKKMQHKMLQIYGLLEYGDWKNCFSNLYPNLKFQFNESST